MTAVRAPALILASLLSTAGAAAEPSPGVAAVIDRSDFALVMTSRFDSGAPALPATGAGGDCARLILGAAELDPADPPAAALQAAALRPAAAYYTAEAYERALMRGLIRATPPAWDGPVPAPEAKDAAIDALMAACRAYWAATGEQG